MRRKLVFIDAETDGLYGMFLTVGMKVTDEKGHEMDRAYYGIKRENMHVSQAWVQENVIPILGEYEPCEDEEELLEKTWEFWMKHREDAYAVADVPFPVEFRLFAKCVEKNPAERATLAPFPLLDLASVLWANGIEPLADRSGLLEGDVQAKQHNAYADAEMCAEILQKIWMERGL